MPKCPQCNKPLQNMPRKCPSCQADLDLLVDYVGQLQAGLEQAERFTRAGELAKAFWAYMAVLEVDPDNPTARRQIGQVVTAVRQFDRTQPGRRWLFQLRGEKMPGEEPSKFWRWVRFASLCLGFVLVLVLGYVVGVNIDNIQLPEFSLPAFPPADNKQMGK